MGRNLKNASREEWVSREQKPSLDELKLGCLLRIADSTEKMTENIIQLQSRYEQMVRLYRQERTERLFQQRRVAALKGVITKLKKAHGLQVKD